MVFNMGSYMFIVIDLELEESPIVGHFALAWRLVKGMGKARALNKRMCGITFVRLRDVCYVVCFLVSNESYASQSHRVQVIRECNSDVMALQEITVTVHSMYLQVVDESSLRIPCAPNSSLSMRIRTDKFALNPSNDD